MLQSTTPAGNGVPVNQSMASQAGSSDEWENKMMKALKANRVDIVEQLLNKNPPDLAVPTMKKFLTKSRLKELYNLGDKTQESIEQGFIAPRIPISLKDVSLTVNRYLPGRNFCSSYNDDSITEFPQPMNELLIWTILTKRHSMAIFMWQHGEEALAKALVASKLYKEMALEAQSEGNLTESEIDNLFCNGAEFEREALALLVFCYRQHAHIAQQLLAREMPNWSNQTCLDLAFASQNRKILAHSCSQILLMNLWLGALAIRMKGTVNVQLCKYGILRVLLAFFIFPFAPFLMKFKPKRDIKRFHLNNGPCPNSVQDKQSELTYHQKMFLFFTAPIVKFSFWSIAYVFFLLTYTYTILIKTPPEPRWNEWYVIAYMTTFGVEKVREILASRRIRKLNAWCSNAWNLCDVFFVVMFFDGLALRMMEDTLDYGRVLYSLNVVYWYIRIVVILRVSMFFGPFLTMIGLMLTKLTKYVVLLLVVLLSYGVFRQSLLFPNEEQFSWSLVRDIFFKPYFMIYGELFIEDVKTSMCRSGANEDGSFDPDAAACVTGSWLNPLLMVLYLSVANILVVNLLISVFSSIFQQVEENSAEIWKINQYAVVIKYKEKPILPPPFVFFWHLYLCFKSIALKRVPSTGSTESGKKRMPDLKLSMKLVESDMEGVSKLEKSAMERLIQEKKTASSDDTNDKKYERFVLIEKRLEELSLKMTELQSLLLRPFDQKSVNLETQTEMTNKSPVVYSEPSSRSSCSSTSSSTTDANQKEKKVLVTN